VFVTAPTGEFHGQMTHTLRCGRWTRPSERRRCGGLGAGRHHQQQHGVPQTRGGGSCPDDAHGRNSIAWASERAWSRGRKSRG